MLRMLGVAVECWGWQWNVGGGSVQVQLSCFRQTQQRLCPEFICFKDISVAVTKSRLCSNYIL
jgi:hypothetical protein